MNKEILERLQEIDKELEEIKKEEENDMNIEELIDNATEEFLNEIEDVDFEIFDEYVKVTNGDNGYINVLLDMCVTNDFKMLVINTLVRVYVWKIYHEGQLRISGNELKNLAIMGITTCEIDPDNKFLQAMIYGLCDGVKGGDR